jgi:hypothetical protein
MSPQAEPRARLSIAAQFPAHFFLENIALRHDNSMLITVVTRNELHYLPRPNAGKPVEPVLLHTFGEMVTGIAELESDVFVVISNNGYTTKENYLHRLDSRKAGRPRIDPGLPEGGVGAEWLLCIVAGDGTGRGLFRGRDLADRSQR